MVYASHKTQYLVVSTCFVNEINDCYIAREAGKESGSLFTLLVIKHHELVKELLEIFRSSAVKWDEARGEDPVIESFTFEQKYVMVMPYRTERPMSRFFVGEAFTLPQCEEICTNVILSCITSGLPWQLLYLVLTQDGLNLTKDRSVYLSYKLDLKDLDPVRSERDCATACAQILLSVLAEKKDQKNISYELLSQKVKNRSYTRFMELYRDIQIASTPDAKRRWTTKIRSFFYRNADQLFGVLFWICLILGIIALALLLTNLAVGDIPFLRIFYNSFKQIGTESLAR